MKKTIALVTGGFTGESVISLKSAEVISRNLDPEKFVVYKIIINPQSWYYQDQQDLKHEINKNDFSLSLGEEIIRFDAVFISLHGSPGEDGKLQGYFDMLDLPYTTCDAISSAITMNKGYTKAIVQDVPELHVAKSVQLFANTTDNVARITKELQLPLFIKPNNGGSSIGMSKVKTAAELPEALQKAFAEDTQVLVEEFIGGREFTIGIYRGTAGVQVLPATEIVSSKEFFDFEAKYTAGVTDEITPGRMTPAEKERVERIARGVFEKLNCKGVTRIDYILQEGTNHFYFIEINTVPGQSENSLIPQQVRAAGRTIQDFYTGLIEAALADKK
ncbi:MAG: D-alanine--D-alanine ligase [Cytophagales bacterium CG18_big_fil_WC_8_21_14_2_50_42_9]|nr:MAG: D-alanine--D-alanine ligase [Cytophagales bacterium CG18_big_fil_WC_8_21_14_2_50_42_9]